MDEMKVTTGFMRNIIAKLVKRAVKKQLGYNIDIQLNELYVSITDSKAYIHLNANAEIDTGDLKKILNNAGLG